MKTFKNTDKDGATKNVMDIKFFGDGDTFKLISKAWSKNEGWMKSTKAMEIPGIGCVIQVSTQQGDNVAEAVCFVPGVDIKEYFDEKGKVSGRCLSQFKASDYDEKALHDGASLTAAPKTKYTYYGASAIQKERERQLTTRKTIEGDIMYNDRLQLSEAAALVSKPAIAALYEEDPESHIPEGWDVERWVKMINKPFRERLVIAGALIAAEIDREDNNDKYWTDKASKR
jgi:hypothetical protein